MTSTELPMGLRGTVRESDLLNSGHQLRITITRGDLITLPILDGCGWFAFDR